MGDPICNISTNFHSVKHIKITPIDKGLKDRFMRSIEIQMENPDGKPYGIELTFFADDHESLVLMPDKGDE